MEYIHGTDDFQLNFVFVVFFVFFVLFCVLSICCFSVFYSRKAWGSLLTEVVSFYREFQSLFHYFVAYFSEQQGEHIKVTFSVDIENMVEIQERVDTHFFLFLNQNPPDHPKQIPFGED